MARKGHCSGWEHPVLDVERCKCRLFTQEQWLNATPRRCRNVAAATADVKQAGCSAAWLARRWRLRRRTAAPGSNTTGSPRREALNARPLQQQNRSNHDNAMNKSTASPRTPLSRVESHGGGEWPVSHVGRASPSPSRPPRSPRFPYLRSSPLASGFSTKLGIVISASVFTFLTFLLYITVVSQLEHGGSLSRARRAGLVSPPVPPPQPPLPECFSSASHWAEKGVEGDFEVDTDAERRLERRRRPCRHYNFTGREGAHVEKATAASLREALLSQLPLLYRSVSLLLLLSAPARRPLAPRPRPLRRRARRPLPRLRLLSPRAHRRPPLPQRLPRPDAVAHGRQSRGPPARRLRVPPRGATRQRRVPASRPALVAPAGAAAVEYVSPPLSHDTHCGALRRRRRSQWSRLVATLRATTGTRTGRGAPAGAQRTRRRAAARWRAASARPAAAYTACQSRRRLRRRRSCGGGCALMAAGRRPGGSGRASPVAAAAAAPTGALRGAMALILGTQNGRGTAEGAPERRWVPTLGQGTRRGCGARPRRTLASLPGRASSRLAGALLAPQDPPPRQQRIRPLRTHLRAPPLPSPSSHAGAPNGRTDCAQVRPYGPDAVAVLSGDAGRGLVGGEPGYPFQRPRPAAGRGASDRTGGGDEAAQSGC